VGHTTEDQHSNIIFFINARLLPKFNVCMAHLVTDGLQLATEEMQLLPW
jgi:hypothetical protein